MIDSPTQPGSATVDGSSTVDGSTTVDHASGIEAEVRVLSGEVVRGLVTSMHPGHLTMDFDGVAMVNVPYSAVRRIGAA